MKKAFSDRIEAEVILRPANPGQNIRQAIRAESVKRFDPPEGTVERVAGKLRKLGFEIVAQGAGSISIAGPKVLFEGFFKLDSEAGPGSETLDVPDEMKDQVEGIYVQSPPTYYRH
jgi:hypothetical protein